MEYGGVNLYYKLGGHLDHGSSYARNSFQYPTSGKRIIHGWIAEEDITCNFARRKGWNGALCISRELFLLCLRNMIGALCTELSDISSVEKE